MNENDLFTAGPSSRAAELLFLKRETEARLAPTRERVARLADDMLVLTFGREVCARRARALRRRGHAVVRYGRSATGKPRFRWMPRARFSPWETRP